MEEGVLRVERQIRGGRGRLERGGEREWRRRELCYRSGRERWGRGGEISGRSDR